MEDIHDIALQECPLCRGTGALEEEGGWLVYVQCLDCGCRTVGDGGEGGPLLEPGQGDLHRPRRLRRMSGGSGPRRLLLGPPRPQTPGHFFLGEKVTKTPPGTPRPPFLLNRTPSDLMLLCH